MTKGIKYVITTLLTIVSVENESYKFPRVLLTAWQQKHLTGTVRSVLLFMCNETPQALLATVCDRGYKRAPAVVYLNTLWPHEYNPHVPAVHFLFELKINTV